MLKNPLQGFKDPARRPRYILWTGAVVVALVGVVVAALGVTSSYWFCADVCHKVQDDTIIAYDRSSHAEVSCMSCHMPAGAGPVTFVLHKAEALGELYLTVTDRFELPLNEGSHLALDPHHMGSEQCTQCHGPNRETTPSEGIIIDHAVHEENDVHCAVCHNRAAHPEDFELTLADNEKHADFMQMEACYRCHGVGDDAMATGACGACHPEDFELKPANHLQPGFYEEFGDSGGHAALAMDDAERIGETGARETTATEEAHEEVSEGAEAHGDGALAEMRPLAEVSYCGTCHERETFCVDCHGVEMPHPAGFTEGHGELGNERPEACANCHGVGPQDTQFCDSCHHEGADPNREWIPQHFEVVRETGAEACFDCHSPTYCAECHVRGG